MVRRSSGAILSRVYDNRQLMLELDDRTRPYQSHEWGGVSRQEAAAQVHRTLFRAIERCLALGLDPSPVLRRAEADYDAAWGGRVE